MTLKHLDISNCGSLRDLQLRMLERPIAELEAGRATSKVRTQALLWPVPPSLHSVHICLSMPQPSCTPLRDTVPCHGHACLRHTSHGHSAGCSIAIEMPRRGCGTMHEVLTLMVHHRSGITWP